MPHLIAAYAVLRAAAGCIFAGSSQSPMAVSILPSNVMDRSPMRFSSAPMPGVNCGRGPALILPTGLNVKLLITRPEPDAERTAGDLRAHGHDVLIAPMLRFEPVQGGCRIKRSRRL
jgi:hypothetical protein